MWRALGECYLTVMGRSCRCLPAATFVIRPVRALVRGGGTPDVRRDRSRVVRARDQRYWVAVTMPARISPSPPNTYQLLTAAGQELQVVDRIMAMPRPQKREHEGRHPGPADLLVAGHRRRVAGRRARAWSCAWSPCGPPPWAASALGGGPGPTRPCRRPCRLALASDVVVVGRGSRPPLGVDASAATDAALLRGRFGWLATSRIWRRYGCAASVADRYPAGRMGARVLVIDNYDSFVYNLVQYLGELGADPIVHRSRLAHPRRDRRRSIPTPCSSAPAPAGPRTPG